MTCPHSRTQTPPVSLARAFTCGSRPSHPPFLISITAPAARACIPAAKKPTASNERAVRMHAVHSNSWSTPPRHQATRAQDNLLLTAPPASGNVPNMTTALVRNPQGEPTIPTSCWQAPGVATSPHGRSHLGGIPHLDFLPSMQNLMRGRQCLPP